MIIYTHRATTGTAPILVPSWTGNQRESKMTKSVNIGNLFQAEPFRYGLRGDRPLWKAMGERLADSSAMSANELSSAVEQAFVELTGHRWTESTPFYCARFDGAAGMSSGSISPSFWQKTAVAILTERFASKQKRAPRSTK